MGDAGLGQELRALARRPLILSLLVLAVVEVVRFATDPGAIDIVVLALIGVVAAAAVRERDRVVDTEGTRRSEAESFARILSGLSRSVSPYAIVDAIV